MMSKSSSCPLHIGDFVIYKPSKRGAALDVMSSSRLMPGKEYKIEEIQNDLYIVVQGYNHPGGGIYWTEFEIGNHDSES